MGLPRLPRISRFGLSRLPNGELGRVSVGDLRASKTIITAPGGTIIAPSGSDVTQGNRGSPDPGGAWRLFSDPRTVPSDFAQRLAHAMPVAPHADSDVQGETDGVAISDGFVQWSAHFSPQQAGLIRGLSVETRVALAQFFMRNPVLARDIVRAIDQQQMSRDYNDVCIRSVMSAMGIVTTDYIMKRLNEGDPYVIGFLHEMVRIRHLIEAGIPVTAIGREFKTEVAYQGWVVGEDGAHIRPYRRHDFIEADAYSKTGQTVFEVKWINDGFTNGKGELLRRLRFNSGSVPLGGYDRNVIKIVMRLFNQARKLGAAMQRGVIGSVEFHITSSRPLNPEVAEFIQEAIPNVTIYVYPNLLSGLAEAVRMPEHPSGRWVPSAASSQRFEWVGLNAVRTAAPLPIPVKAGKRPSRPRIEPIPEPETDSQAVAPLTLALSALDDALVQAVYGPGFFGDSVVEPHLSQRVLSRDLAVRASLSGAMDDVRQTLDPLLIGQGGIPPLNLWVRAVSKELGRLRLGIPSEMSGRTVYLQNLRTAMQSVATLGLLAAQWRSADARLRAVSPQLTPEELSNSIAAPLQRVNDSLMALESSPIPDTGIYASEVTTALADLELQLARLSGRAPQATVSPAMTLAALIGRDVQDVSERKLGLLSEGDRAIYRALVQEVLAQRRPLLGDTRYAYQALLAETEAALDGLVKEMETLTRKGADEWSKRLGEIELQLGPLRQLDAKLATLKDAVRVVPGVDRTITELLGDLKERLTQPDGADPNVVRAAIADADTVLDFIAQLVDASD